MRARVLLSVLILATVRADACCPAFPREQPVRIADQEILVVWDPATKVEHFVRKATFNATAKGFGFLVPTPAKPELAEASNDTFDKLRHEIRTRYVDVTRYRVAPTALVLAPFLMGRAARDGAVVAKGVAPPPSAPVRVLETKRVAGYDAAVLEADDAAALTRWLGENGYDARPALTEWVEPYVARKWKVTAFKFVAEAGGVETGTVRMSFATDRPLFPYRVPKDQLVDPEHGHLLRVFYVGPGRASGTLGDAAKPWTAETKYAAPIEDAAILDRSLPARVAAGSWVTAFEDRTWPGGTEDLWFSPAGDASKHVPTEERVRWATIPIPLDVIVVLAVAVAVVRRRRSTPS